MSCHHYLCITSHSSTNHEHFCLDVEMSYAAESYILFTLFYLNSAEIKIMILQLIIVKIMLSTNNLIYNGITCLMVLRMKFYEEIKGRRMVTYL